MAEHLYFKIRKFIFIEYYNEKILIQEIITYLCRIICRISYIESYYIDINSQKLNRNKIKSDIP